MRALHTWIHPQIDATAREAAARLERECGIPAPVARVLCQRGHHEPSAVHRLLEPRLEHLLDPFAMADMTTAVERMRRAVRDREPIVVNGDYDADGVTGTALLVSELRAAGAEVHFFIPDRERDGYGIAPRLVRRAGEIGVRVLLSVDCGSSDHEAIALARDLGIDAIVIDHHEIPDLPAAAHAVLNPKRPDCAYPFKGLSAVGVAYKLLQALADPGAVGRGGPSGLDLVALGTLADAQPVIGENRTLVALGLQCLTHAPRPGVRALRDEAGVHATVDSRQVGFRLVPRLNAVGRVARGKLAVDLLLAPDAASAAQLAAEMETQNRWRQAIGQKVTQAALEAATALWSERQVAALVVAAEAWHPGVVGISAARLADRFGVPAAVIGFQNGSGRGSVRSAGGVDVRAALEATAHLLVKYGGHREAAGFTILPQHLATFTADFEAAVRDQGAGAAARELVIDAELGAPELDAALVAGLERLEPFGSGHPEPLFLLRDLRVGPRTRRVGDGHLKLQLETGRRVLDGIAFGRGAALSPAETIGSHLDVVAHVRRQDARWGDGPQLVVADLAASGAGTLARNGA